MLQGFARTAVAGIVMLCAPVIGVRSASAQTKAAQKAVGYQDKPKGPQQCDGCMLFVAPASCKVVEGDIAPAGWCRMYTKKPA
jgi:hypothetical protein